MNSILIASPNAELLMRWRQLLAIDYHVTSCESFVATHELNAYQLVIVDTVFLDQADLSYSQIKEYQTKFLIIGQQWPEEQQVNVLVSGAAGYCEQSAPTSVILKATESILQGDIWIQRHLVHKVIGSLVRITSSQQPEPRPLSTANILSLDTLSGREIEVAYLIRQGTCNKDIASTLFISERTVKAHLTSIFKKLNVADRLHLGILLKETAEDIFQQYRNKENIR